MPIVQSQNTHRQSMTSAFGLGCRPYELINIPFRAPIDGGVPGPPSTDGNAPSTATPLGSYPFERPELNSAEVNELVGDIPIQELGLVHSPQPDPEEVTSQVKEDLRQQGTFPSGLSESPVASPDSCHNDRPSSTVPSRSNITAAPTQLQGASGFSISGQPHFTNIGVNSGVNNVTNINYYGESLDVTEAFFHFVEEIRKIKTQPAGGETANNADSSAPPQAQPGRHVVVDDIVPSNPSLLHASSVADKYTRSMLTSLAGYPLYEPEPYKGSTTGRLRECLYPGDVGFIRENGAFDVLFNICPTKNALRNPPALPSNFTPPDREDIKMEKKIQFQHKTRLFNFVDRKKNLFRRRQYHFSESGGAILELPEGATRSEVTNMLTFKELALHQGKEWYRYTMSQGRDIRNGSLYLVTSTTMCTYWGMAVVQSRPNPSEGLRFVRNKKLFFFNQTPKFVWEGSGTAITTFAPDPKPGDEVAQTQCVFLRGFKIKLREDIWDKLHEDRCELHEDEVIRKLHEDRCELHEDEVIRKLHEDRCELHEDEVIRKLHEDEVIYKLQDDRCELHKDRWDEDRWDKLHDDRRDKGWLLDPTAMLSPVHPSDLINDALLGKGAPTEIEVTHDDEWCELMLEIFQSPESVDFAKIARSFLEKRGAVCKYAS